MEYATLTKIKYCNYDAYIMFKSIIPKVMKKKLTLLNANS